VIVIGVIDRITNAKIRDGIDISKAIRRNQWGENRNREHRNCEEQAKRGGERDASEHVYCSLSA